MALNHYGAISPSVAATAAKELLKRGQPYLVLEKFGQAKPLPTNQTKTMVFRRYNALPSTPQALSEGVTPTSQPLTVTDVTANLTQYGGLVSVTDVVHDTHTDPVLMEAMTVLGEQAAQMIEKVRYGVLKAGTNVMYANGATRSAVNTPVTLALQRRVVRTLKRQNGREITKVVKSTPAFGTEPVGASFVGLIHPDLEADVRSLPGFVPVEKYGQVTPWESEIGKCENVRYVNSTTFEAFADAGGDKEDMISSSGTKADVYPILYVAADAYGIVALKGMYAVTPMVVNPSPVESDPLGQRGHAGWKSMQTAVILNDAWLVRAEVAATA